MRTLASLVISFVLAVTASPLLAQEVVCDGEGRFPCGFALDSFAVAPVAPMLNLQARVAQAGMMVDDRTLDQVLVRVLSGRRAICQESFSSVRVMDGMLNLQVGANMSCDLARAMQEHPGLAFQVCLESASSCLKPFGLATVPYAVRAGAAMVALGAKRANRATAANYTHRFAADRDMTFRRKIQIGYFDFLTPSAQEAAPVYSREEFIAHEDGGIITWSPLRDAAAYELHFAAKDAQSDTLGLLSELVIHSDRIEISGQVMASSVNISAGGAQVMGDLTIGGDLVSGGTLAVAREGIDGANSAEEVEIGGSVTAGQLVTVIGDFSVVGDLDVTGGSTLGGSLDVSLSRSGGVAGGVAVGDTLRVGNALEIAGSATASSATLDGVITGVTLIQSDAFTVADNAFIGGHLGAAPVTSSGDILVGGAAVVSGALTVHGEAVFHEHVVFEGDLPRPAAADTAYLQYDDEQRAVAFGGGLTVGGGLSLGGSLALSSAPFRGLRIASSQGAPRLCDAANEGLLYLDAQDQLMKVCLGGDYVVLNRPAQQCGDGSITADELCDTGALALNDGCSDECQVDAGWTCAAGGPTLC